MRLRATPWRDLIRIEPVGADGNARWRATGNDPVFFIRRRLPWWPIGAGTWRLEARLRECGGDLDAPCLYPDYGRGSSESNRIDLPPPDADGVLRATVRFRSLVWRLRFDPSRAPCEFDLGGVVLTRVARWRVASAMLRESWRQLRVRAKDTGWPAALAYALRFVRDAGPRAVLDALHAGVAGAGDAPRSDYLEWTRRFDTPSAAALERAAADAAAFAYRPLVSIVVPVYQTPEAWLRRMLDSVRAQTYPEWELCIADDASTAPHVGRVLAEYAAADPRIRTMRRAQNGHISAASNSALALARGDYVALLDHDDELAPLALHHVVERLQQAPRPRIVYSDEDKLDAEGLRCEPYFKPDWDPDLALGQNFVNHLCVYERELMVALGGFRTGFEGAQDYDLLLRASERVAPAGIAHIPRVLYHWRAADGSTALRNDDKSYAAERALQAVSEHLARRGAAARVERVGVYQRVRHAVPAPAPTVDIIVPTRDRVELLRRCVESTLVKTQYPAFRLVIVDNDSRERATRRFFEQAVADPRVVVQPWNQPFNFSAINNFAVSTSGADVVVLMNNDIEVIQGDWLEEMVAHAMREGIGAVGAMLYYPNNLIQHAGVVLGVGGVADHAYKNRPRGYSGQMSRAQLVQRMGAVTAACLAVQRRHWNAVGGMDEKLQVAFNDIDLCLRLSEHGLASLWTPFAEFYHWESASRGAEDSPQKQARFGAEIEHMQARWGTRLTTDPAYNPNLTLRGEPYALAWPPREASGKAWGAS